MQKVYCIGERTRRTYRRRKKRRHLVSIGHPVVSHTSLYARNFRCRFAFFPLKLTIYHILFSMHSTERYFHGFFLFPENESAEIESWMKAPIVNLRAFNFFSIVERKENGEKSYDSSGVQQSWKKRKDRFVVLLHECTVRYITYLSVCGL